MRKPMCYLSWLSKIYLWALWEGVKTDYQKGGGKKIFLPLRNSTFISVNQFTNAFLFNPHNSTRWILLSTFNRWEKWSSKVACTAGNFHRLLIKKNKSILKKVGMSLYCVLKNNINNDNKNHNIQVPLFLLAKKDCDSVQLLTFDWQGFINAKYSFLLRLKPMRKKAMGWPIFKVAI